MSEVEAALPVSHGLATHYKPWGLAKSQGVPPVYDLFAISQHYGSLGGGHYTATCEYEGQGWYAFNDTGVSAVDGMDPVDSARSAYVLFYRRQQDLRSSP
ncbi:Ubiquitin carboxyl-terminal hydrolase 15, partial [Xylographa carneopallida]|nr:Ubiquitin carboxyl-terminal hydrolase 15 [Xylographa carneopallida]